MSCYTSSKIMKDFIIERCFRSNDRFSLLISWCSLSVDDVGRNLRGTLKSSPKYLAVQLLHPSIFYILGRRDVVEFLLRIEAPAAVYDNVGTCAVALMVEKMPDLTMKALDQFLIEDKPTRTNYFHLCSLEYDTRCKIGRTPAKSVLEVTHFYLITTSINKGFLSLETLCNFRAFCFLVHLDTICTTM